MEDKNKKTNEARKKRKHTYNKQTEAFAEQETNKNIYILYKPPEANSNHNFETINTRREQKHMY